jgi:hypothetical protein
MEEMAPILSGTYALGFLFLGVCDEKTYSVRVHDMQHLKRRIREAAASVTADVLGRVWQEMEF